MQDGKKRIYGILACCGMLVIILDGKTALYSMQEGISLCVQTVIPALFPFFLLSGIVCSSLLGQPIKAFHPLSKLCRIPKGSESLLIIGLLSGYPVGAQLVTQAYHDGKLPHDTAKRMLGFCSNAGPAFIFGMLSPLFSKASISWLLWCIHIVGALLVGFLLPGNVQSVTTIKSKEPITLQKALKNAVKNMVTVCSWVIVFRLVLGFCDRWFLWLLPVEARVLFAGILELSNGCVMLRELSQDGMRFILASVMLSFGGLCVGMQTLSVTENLGCASYFPGKVLQTLICASLSCILQIFVFSKEESVIISPAAFLVLGILTVLYLYLLHRKKVVAFTGRMLYNTTK